MHYVWLMVRFLLLLLLSSALLLFGENPPLKVGMELGYPPFEMVCPDGSPCGISVDIANALGQYLNRPVVVQNLSFVGLIPSLNSQKIDVVISSLTVTQKRQQAADFSIPYAKIGLSLLASAASSVQSIEDVNKKGICVVVKLGTSGEAYAAKHLPQAIIRVLDKEGMCVLEVIQNKADVFIYDQLSVYKNWKKNPLTTRALLKSFQEESWAVAVRKDNDELLSKINLFIEKFRSKNGFEKLGEKYLPKEKAAFQELGVPFIF